MENEIKSVKMTAKEYLNRGRRLDELIDSKLREIDRLRRLSTSVSSPPADTERASGGLPQSRVENTVVKIVALEEEINAETDRLVDIHREIRTAIESLNSPKDRLILRERYINDLSWEEIAAKMHYSVRQTTRLHGAALRRFEKILENVHKCP